jgi:phosphate transport system substrate-binding protein
VHFLKNTFLILIITLLISSCGSNDVKGPTDTLSTGTIDISVDETYRPIIEDQLRVFDSSYPEANICAHYKPEADCIKDFLNDSARLILVTRDLSSDEKKFLEQKKVVPTALAVAKDAVAIVLNNSSSDTLFSKSQLRGILTGVYSKKYTVVFDNQRSSTLRYMLDSLIPGEKLGANVFAAKGNDSVLAYVAKNPGAIGFVGVSYVADYADPAGLAFIQTVKVSEVFNDILQKPFAPYQAYIAPDWYPLTRELFYIHRETYPGLGTGFANFISRERGQLIFKQARLFPLRSNVIFRNASINTE